ncbi:MAG: hypothetical protein GW833_06925, partial [Desulfuromonadales bacterium]|nr:hypothetical protein [Desulfuromonadales bacterium]
DGATFNTGESFTIDVAATTPTGYTIASIEFFDNGASLGSGTATSFNYTQTTSGPHTFTALTTYTTSETAVSLPVNVMVVGADSPTLVVDPVATSYDLGSTINLSVVPEAIVGIDPIPVVTLVTFFEGTTQLGTDVVAPYEFAYTPTTGGVKNLTVNVLYSNGVNNSLSATSAVVPVTVNDTVAAPASITVPATSSTGNYQISWEASATVGVTYTLEESDGVTVTTIPGITNTFYDVTGKANGTYTYQVKAVKSPMTDSGWAVGGNGAFVDLPSTMVTPLNNTSLTGTSETFTWDANSFASKYEIWAGTAVGGRARPCRPAVGRSDGRAGGTLSGSGCHPTPARPEWR